MSARRNYSSRAQIRQASRHNTVVRGRSSRRGRRTHYGDRNEMLPFAPPEDWHEPAQQGAGYRIIVRNPGPGYRHVVTPAQVRQRLSEVPAHFLEPLETVQFSRMTRKKQSFPCYGMQWGTTLYLYPLEESLVEYFDRPPRPSLVNEAKMYGGRWQSHGRSWRLVWTLGAIQDFYLNNILIHELGHLLDDRNTSYADRERFAEWFAIHHGYRPTGGSRTRRRAQVMRRRHHAKSS